MKYFISAYKNFRKINKVFREAYEQGLEFRIRDGFFYNPETQNYDRGIRKRFLELKKILTDDINKISDSNPNFDIFSEINMKMQVKLALNLYSLFHPIEKSYSNKLFKRKS